MSTTLGQIEVDGKQTLGRILKGKLLAVPRHQRDYSWREEEVRVLYQDFKEAIKSKQQEYFLGSLVTVDDEDGDRVQVVDGQQRLATATILLAAIRDYLLSHSDNRATKVELQYLFSWDVSQKEGDSEPRLTLNTVDREYFEHRVLSRPESVLRNIKPSSESHDRIDAAAQIAAETVSEVAKQDVEDLFEWTDFLEKHARIIWVSAADPSSAFVMFETLNDRGLDLTMADLLKNFLLGKSKPSLIGETEQRWIEMRNTIINAGDEKLVLAFLHHFWISQHGPTRARELYAKIKSAVHNEKQVRALGKELADTSTTYAALLTPNSQFWQDFQPAVGLYANILYVLKAVAVRPLVMAILFRFKKKDAEAALRLLVSSSVRLLITGRAGGGFAEEMYGQTAKQVNNEIISGVKGLQEALVKALPTDLEFQNKFLAATVSQNYLVQYYLQTLETEGSLDVEKVKNPSTDVVTVEHIMPKSLQKWPQISPEIGRAYLRRLGNLALLKKGLNKDSEARPFSEKKQFYQQSEFKLTKMLAELPDKWGPEQIEERQQALSKKAVKAWSLNLNL